MPFLGGRRRMASALPTHHRMPGDFLLLSYRNTVSMHQINALHPKPTEPMTCREMSWPESMRGLRHVAPGRLFCSPPEGTDKAGVLGTVVRVEQGKDTSIMG